MRWVHAWIRRHTKPIPRDVARRWQQRLAFAYYMLAWTGAGILFLELLTGHKGLPEHLDIHADPNASKSLSAHYARTMSVENAKIYKMNKFDVEKEEDFSMQELREQKESKRRRINESFYGDIELSTEEEEVEKTF